MSRSSQVTLQINVAPTDFPHAVHTLPHQLRSWGAQVHEILFTFDLHRTAHGGRFAEGWEERRVPMQRLLEDLCDKYSTARIVEVDYAPQAMQDIADLYTGGRDIPAKDTKGAPYYPYLHGLYAARNDLVFHLDSDVMFGGGSQTWIAEARMLFDRAPDMLSCSPLPGPPTDDGTLRSKSVPRIAHDSLAFRFDTISSRLCLLDRDRLRERLLPLPLLGPIRPLSTMKARLHGNPPFRALELVLGETMRAAGMYRVDFLGAPPGMWSLHPPFRSQKFYEALPRLIEQIESGNVPDAQRGDFDINDSMFDWSAPRARAAVRRLWV